MGTAERRNNIMKTLCRRRYETVANLAHEFGVSERTILRDIEVLSFTEPIYTQCGRYGGGVYVTDNYYIDRMYMNEKEINALSKIFSALENKNVRGIGNEEKEILKSIISQYAKPTIQGRKKYDK